MSGDQRSQSGARQRLLISLPLILFAGLALVFLMRLYGGDPSKLPSALVGKPIPEFTISAVGGLLDKGVQVKGFSTADLRGSKVSLVNFWASWCPPCRAEHPYLMELGNRTDIALFGVNQKDDPENARRFLGLHGNPFFKTGADPKGRVSIDWGVYGLPETFVVDAQGIIRYKHVGPITEDSLKRLEPEIEAAKQPLTR